MMRSLSSGVAGLRTHQTRMDVIGNNIANVNTFGFKSSRATFADVYYQNLSGGRSASTQTGGMNPTQIGYGSAVATIDIMQSVAGSSSTDRAMDVYIAGDGFLVSKDASGAFKYTRLGNLGFDAAGNLVDSNGNYVQGFPMNADGTPNINADGKITGDALQRISVDPAILDKLTGISISTSGAIVGLLPGDTTLTMSSTNPGWILNDTAVLPEDSNYRGDVTLAISGYANASAFNSISTTWANLVSSVEMGNMALPAGGWSIEVSNSGVVTMIFSGSSITGEPNVTLSGKLDKNGQVVMKKSGSTNDVGLILNINASALGGSNQLPPVNSPGSSVQLKLCKQLTTYDKGGNLVKLNGPNGTETEPMLFTPSGSSVETLTFGDFRVDIDMAQRTNAPSFNQKIGRAEPAESSTLVLGNLVIAKFRNAQGLLQSGTSSYETTSNSGDAEYTLPGLEGTGSLKAGYLEMSNVDLSKEFTEMITTQRGFQANSRIITVSDTMLEELVNLKR